MGGRAGGRGIGGRCSVRTPEQRLDPVGVTRGVADAGMQPVTFRDLVKILGVHGRVERFGSGGARLVQRFLGGPVVDQRVQPHFCRDAGVGDVAYLDAGRVG